MFLNGPQLYNKFARRYRLHEASLAIIYCSGYSDPLLVENVWREIIQQEDVRENPRFIESLHARVIETGRKFYPSEVVFPLGFLIHELEKLSFESQTDRKEWVFETMLEVGVPFALLFRIYNQISNSRVSTLTPFRASKTQTTCSMFALDLDSLLRGRIPMQSSISFSSFSTSSTEPSRSRLKSESFLALLFSQNNHSQKTFLQLPSKGGRRGDFQVRPHPRKSARW